MSSALSLTGVVWTDGFSWFESRGWTGISKSWTPLFKSWSSSTCWSWLSANSLRLLLFDLQVLPGNVETPDRLRQTVSPSTKHNANTLFVCLTHIVKAFVPKSLFHLVWQGNLLNISIRDRIKCCFPHHPVVNKFLRPSLIEAKWFKVIKESDWKWLKVIENIWKWTKVTEIHWKWLKLTQGQWEHGAKSLLLPKTSFGDFAWKLR